MKLSILDSVTISPGISSAQALAQVTQLACLAERLGYSRYWITEHHAVHYEATPAPEILVGHILQRTRQIQVAIGGILLNYHNPYKMAEVVRTLHALFAGRFETGIGRGSSGPVADFALNNRRINRLDNQDYDRVLTEFLHWVGNDFSADNPFSQIPIMPDQPDAPAIWLLAATVSSAIKAASLGLRLAWAGFINPADSIEGISQYRQQFSPAKFAVSQAAPHTLLAVRVIVAKTQQQAERLAMPVRLLFKIRREQQIMPARMPTTEQAIQQAGEIFPAEQQPWPMYVVGDQQQVYDKLSRMLQQTQADELLIQDILPDMEQRKESLHMLAELFNLEPPEK